MGCCLHKGMHDSYHALAIYMLNSRFQAKAAVAKLNLTQKVGLATGEGFFTGNSVVCQYLSD